MTNLTMADLLAKQEKISKRLSIYRGQEIEGRVVLMTDSEIVFDLGTKSEGVLQKKELSLAQIGELKIGDNLQTVVVHTENESGQVVLGMVKAPAQNSHNPFNQKFQKFAEARDLNQVLTGRGLEVNKGGLIVEVFGTRGFLPTSQVTLSQAVNLEELVGKDIQVTVIELDAAQNRLIFSQKTKVSDDTAKKLNELKIGQIVKGQVAAVLAFGIFVTLPDDIEGLVHISELAWEKVEDPVTIYKIGDQVEAKVISVEPTSGRVNLSIKQLLPDPFNQMTENFSADDVIKATVVRISSNGVHLSLDGGVEGLIQTAKMDQEAIYQPGQSLTCLIDSIDKVRRRVNLAPFITSTKDLIYK